MQRMETYIVEFETTPGEPEKLTTSILDVKGNNPGLLKRVEM